MMNWHIVNSDVFRNGTPIETHLYFLKDTGEIYRGSQPFTESVILCTEFPTTSIAINRLYIKSSTLEGKVYDGSAWTIVIKPLDDTITEDGSNPVSGKAVADYVAAEIAKLSTTTVEGLVSTVNALSETVETNKTETDAAIEAETQSRIEADNNLSSRIATNETAIGTLNADAATEGSVLNVVNTVLKQLVGDGTQDTIDSLTELVDWANEHSTDVVEMNNQINKNKTDISNLTTLLGTLPEGVTATTVVAYIAEAVAGEKTRAESAEKELSDLIDEIKTITDGLGTAATKNVEEFASAAQGEKADNSVQKSNIATSATISSTVADASDEKVISEKALLDLLTWKETM